MFSIFLQKLKRIAWQAYRVADGLRAVGNKSTVVRHILGRHPESTCEYKLKHCLRLQVSNHRMDRTAIFSIQEIFNEETYHLPDCEGSRVIVDLGANIGVYSLYASWKYPAAKIYAIEPDLDNAKQLMDNVALNGLNTRIAVVRMAVSATEGNVLLFRNPDSSRGHTLARRSEGELGLIVESKSLEELFEAYKIDSCDLLKMDIEGAEYEVLYGCKPEFLRKIRAMAIEFHPFYPSIPEAKMDRQRYGPDGLTSYLRDNGFTTTRGKHEILYAQRP